MTNYFSIQHFRMVNLSFIILKKIPLCMRLTAIMLFVCIGLAYASDSYSQSATLTLNVNNKTVQEVLDEIEKQSEFHFFYNNKQVNTNRVVSIKPINSQRFGLETPCVKNGSCFDCKSSDCICCQVLVTRFSRIPKRFKIILVDDVLGF